MPKVHHLVEQLVGDDKIVLQGLLVKDPKVSSEDLDGILESKGYIDNPVKEESQSDNVAVSTAHGNKIVRRLSQVDVGDAVLVYYGWQGAGIVPSSIVILLAGWVKQGDERREMRQADNVATIVPS